MFAKNREPLFFEFLDKRQEFLNKNTFINSENFIWTSQFESNYTIIRDEIMHFYTKNKEEFHPYFAENLVSSSGKWRSFGFYFWGIRSNAEVRNSIKQTMGLLKKIPGIVSASVSIMEPGSEIKAHYGDTNAIYRCHFGLIIPAGLPETGLRVGYEDRSWETGKFLVFNDAAYHKAWNRSKELRMILIIDVIRPEFEHKKLWICCRIQSIIYSQKLIKRYPGIKPALKNKPVQWILSACTMLLLLTVKRSKLWL